MKFDDALDQLEPRTIWSNEMRDLLEQLRQEYEPKIYLKKSDKEMLLYYLENANFSSLLERILSSKTSTLFGVGSIENVPFYGLSEEDIMYAWLHPDSIERK